MTGTFKISALLVAVLAVTAPAHAIPVQITDGTFLGVTAGANDPFPRPFMGSPALYKCDDVPEGLSPTCTDRNGAIPGEDYSDGDFTITFTTFEGDVDEEEAIGGTWSFAPNGGETLLPTKLVLKAGNAYAAYDITGLLSGMWSTADHLDSKGISHISFYDTGVPQIPIPAALPLFLTALAGAGFLGRRRRRQT